MAENDSTRNYLRHERLIDHRCLPGSTQSAQRGRFTKTDLPLCDAFRAEESLRTDRLDYELPGSCIARYPTADRDGARMLVVTEAGTADSAVSLWPQLLPEGALVVVNDTRVFKARLLGNRRSTGGRVELLLLAEVDGPSGSRTRQMWHAIGRANKPIATGTIIEFQTLVAKVSERLSAGELLVELESDEPIENVIDRIGHVPIPPYLGREDEPSDAERYQTLFAKRRGSVAAPTAGIHLSQAVLDKLSRRGIFLGTATLHVGIGTFRPIVADDLDAHSMHSERIEINAKLVAEINEARKRKSPVIAVGTTVVRALESAADPHRPGCVLVRRGSTKLLIQPGYTFKVVDGLLTNFHMPRSTLLALVGAFAGLERTLAAYQIAVRREYRFLSYGDAMWIPKKTQILKTAP